MKPFHVAKTESFELIVPEVEDLQVGHRDAAGFEDPVPLEVAAVTLFSRSRHYLGWFSFTSSS
jgi:hypothetical protein